MATVKKVSQHGQKVEWTHRMLLVKPEITYKAFCEAWREEGYTDKPPAETGFYRAKRELRAKGAIPPAADSVATDMEPSSNSPKKIRRRPGRRKSTVKKIQRLKEVSKVESNGEMNHTVSGGTEHSVMRHYEELEYRLDEMMIAAEKLRNHQLVLAIRHARRLTSVELLK